VAAAKNVQRIVELVDTSLPGYLEDPGRFYQIALSTWAARHGVSFEAFKSDSWNLIASMIPCPDRELKLRNLNVPRFIVEQYCHVKEAITKEFAIAKAHFKLPFMSLNLDLYQNSIQNKKYLCLRISYDFNGCQMSRNIAMREYSPSYLEREKEQASALLWKWVEAILLQFGINDATDILTGSGDSGSDVKRVMDVLMEAFREWCVSHLINLALVDAFGTSVDKKNSKNVQSREVFDTCRKVMESVNKSTSLKARFEANQHDLLQKVRKLKNSPAHRWSAMEDVLQRILVLWEPLMMSFTSVGQTFPLEGGFLVEFYSVLSPVRSVQMASQAVKTLTSLKVYLDLVSLYATVLKPTALLEIIDPARPKRMPMQC